MSRKKTTKKVLVSPQLVTREYDIQHPYTTLGAVYNALIEQQSRKLKQEAEAQAKERQKELAEAKEKAFENNSVVEQNLEKQQVPTTNKQSQKVAQTSKKQRDISTTDWGKWFSDLMDQTAAKKFVPSNDILLPQSIAIEDPTNTNYIIDPYASERYNAKQKRTAEAAADREIRRQYGSEIDAYDEQLRLALEYDDTTNAEIDRYNRQIVLSGASDKIAFKPYVDTASIVKQQWENSDTFLKIQATRDYILQNYTPNEALANKVLEYGISEYNPQYVKTSNQNNLNAYKIAKSLYAEALKRLNNFRKSFGIFGPNTEEMRDEYRTLQEDVKQKSLELTNVEKSLDSGFDAKDKYERYLSSLSNSIRTLGLPKTKDKLTKYSQYIINELGLMNVLYNQDGSLNEEFVGVGYASDKEIKDAASNAANYFRSAKTKSGFDVLDDYLDKVSEDVELKKEMYEHLSKSDPTYRNEYKNLERAQVILDKARRHKELNNIVKRADGFWTKQTAKNIGYGIGEKIKDPGMWTFGISDLIESINNSKIADKIKSGQKLTPSEKSIASALAIESVMHQNYGDYEKTMGFKAGQVATESLKFMTEMAMTSGGAALLQAPGKAAMKAAANKYIKKYGADGFKNILGRNLVKTPGFIKMVGGDAAYSLMLANTLLAPSTIAEINRLSTGEIVPGVENDELAIVDYEGEKSLPKAIYEAEARAFTENMSEMIGEYGIGAFLKYPFRYFGKQAIKNSKPLLGAYIKGVSVVEDAQNLINKMLPTKAISSFIKPVGSFIKAGHYSGIIGETAEEYYGNAMLHLFGVSEGTKTVVDENGNEKQVKTSFWEEINPTTELGKQTFLDIIGGIALSSGFLGAGSALNYARIAHNYDKNRKILVDYVGEDLVEKMESSLTQAHSANVAATANTIIRGISNARDREAFIDFYESMMRFHGANQADLKIRESNDNNVFELAKRDAEINGYSVEYNTQRVDLQRAVDTIKEYAEQQLGVDEGTIDEVIENNGGIEEVISYLKSTGRDSAASAVMAYNNTKAQYEASMRRLMDDIDEDLANNEKWVNRLADKDGNVIIGTTKDGKKVYIKSGARSIGGKIYKSGEKAVIINTDGSISSIETKNLNDDFEKVSANEIKHNLDILTYELASRGFDASENASKIGVLIQMSKGRVGTILNKTADGRIMYSVNDPSVGTEVVRITDPGITEEQLIKDWADSYNLEFLNNQIKKAQTQLNQNPDRSAQVVATRELREYIRDVKEKQRADLETKHGKAIKYVSGVLTSNTVNDVLKKLKDLRVGYVGAYAKVFNDAGVTVDASNWERLRRLTNAFRLGQLSKKEFKEILVDGSTKMSDSAKEDLENITVDKYGNVTRWKDQDDTNLFTHSDIEDEDLSEEDLNAAEDIVNEDIKKENKFLNSKSQRRLREKAENEQKAADKKESKKKGETGRNAAKKRRAELKKTRKQKLAEKTKKNEAGLPKKINNQVSEHKDTTPTSAPGDITRSAAKEVQSSNQQNSIEKLLKRAEWTEANVLRDLTTGHNYFIMINGKRVMFTRVHGILDDQYENLGYDAQVNANIERLTSAYNKGGIDTLKSEISLILGEKKEFGIYASYLDENPDEYEAVIDGVAHIGASKLPGVSVVFGLYIDEMCRLFFSGEEINLNTMFEDGTTVGSHMDLKVLDKFINQCKQLKLIYDALGWKLISDRTVFTYNVYDNETNKNVNIAGETDMIGVDRQGNYHIIDFKTSYKKFESFFNDKGEIINLFESIPSPYKGNKAKRSTREQYENQLTMYSLMVESTLGGNVESIEIMPFTLNYTKEDFVFHDIDNQQKVLNNAKSSTYDIKVPQRIILSKNGKLISRFSEQKDKKDIDAKKKLDESLMSLSEITLNKDINDLPDSQKQYIQYLAEDINNRIKQIKLSANLVYSEQDCNNIINTINGIKTEQEELTNYIQDKVNDNKQSILESERLLKEKEAAQQSHDAWLLKLASAQLKWEADWKAAFETDYQKLLNLCRYLDNWAKQHDNNYTVLPELKEQFDQLVSNLEYMIEFDDEVLGTTSGRILGLDEEIIDKVNKCINWVRNTVVELTPVEPVVPPTSIDEYKLPEKSWRDTNGLYKDEFKGSPGVSSAVSLDDDQLPLTDVTRNADFIDNSEFRIISNNGKIYVQITYNGRTYTPIAFFNARTEAGKKLYSRITTALRSASSNQKVIISGGVKRSFGEFIVKEEGQYKTAHEQGMISLKDGEPGVNIYDIEYSSTQSTIGITYTREIQNGNSKIPVTEVRVPSSEDVARLKFERLTQSAGWITDKATGAKRRMAPDSPYALAFGSAIYTYSNVNPAKPKSSGIFVFMHNLGYTDDPKCCVPITMRHSFISENDAKFIVDALLGNYNGLIKKKTGVVSENNILGFNTTSTEFVKGFGGNVVIGGQTIDIKISDILDLLIPVKGCPSYESQLRRQSATEKMPIYMDLDNVNETGEVIIVGNIEGDGIVTKQRSFNINTADGRLALEIFLQKVERNMNMNGFAQVRLGNIGSNTDQYGYPMPLSNNPTGGVTLKEYVLKNGSLRFGNSCIQFESSDFSNPNIKGDTNGITGIGWYLKNGFLECMYNGTEDPLIRIEDDAQISTVDENPIEPLKLNVTKEEQKAIEVEIKSAVPETQEVDLASMLLQQLENGNDATLDALNSALDGYYKTQNEDTKTPINEEEARKNLERILGKDVPVKFIPTVVAVSKSGARMVGVCKDDAIIISNQAEAGVEYHEAFHRVMELLFTPELRKKAYDKFRSSKQGRKSLTDKQIAELFADEFMYYAMNQPIIKFHWNIIKTFREIKDWIDMWKTIGSYNLFRMYTKINSGKYANVKPDIRSIQGFLQRTKGKGYFYTVNGHNFENILNNVHYKKLLNFIALSFMNESVLKINIDGSNLKDFKIDLSLLTRKQIDLDNPVLEDTTLDVPRNFFTIAMENAPESTRFALQEIIDNFDVIKPDLAAYISLFASDYKVKYEQINDRLKDGVDVIGGQFDDKEPTTSEEDIFRSWIDDHIKESYEFKPITRTTEKTKFFFSGIPKKTLTEITVVENGVPVKKQKYILKTNELGLPEMYDMQYAFTTVLNEVSDSRSVPEFYEKLLKLGEHNDLFYSVAEKFGKLWNDVLNGKATADEEAYVVQIFTQLKSTTSEFVLAKSINNGNGLYDVLIEKTDMSYRAKQYVTDWALSFAIGGCRFFRQDENGNYVMNGKFTPNVFSQISGLFTDIINLINSENEQTVSEINKIKQSFCLYLNILGIPFTTDMLDKYLWSTYNNVGKQGLLDFIKDNKNKIDQFCNKIALLNYNNQLNITEGNIVGGTLVTLDKLLAGDNFLTELANAKYLWHRSHDQMCVLIANRAKAYTKSENNLLTDRLDEIMYDDEEQHNLMSDPYIYNSDKNTGSIFLKNRGAKLRFVTMGGFKTDEYGNAGIDYLQQSKREDYISKAVALMDGEILSPTMSDKKSYGFVAGLEHVMSLFQYGGTNFGKTLFNSIVVDEEGNIIDFYVPDNVVNQLIEYAECEHAAIEHTLNQFKLLPENKKVDNYHKGKSMWIKDGKVYKKKDDAPKDAIEVHPIQGARYTSMLGVYEDGQFVEFNQLIDENGNYKDEWANFNTAKEKFFDKSPEEKQKLIRELLLNRLRQELKAVENLGLIKQAAVGSNTKEVMLSYLNVGLPSSRINAIENQIKDSVDKSKLSIAQLNAIHSLAVVSFIADVMNRHIISIQEFERIFSGNPSFFKFEYSNTGHLVDRTTDQSKRFGGLVSTGTNNCLDIPGFPKDYTAVEIDNPIIVSDQIDDYEKRIYDNELRSNYLRYLLEQNGITFDEDGVDHTAEEIASSVDKMTLEEIEEAAKDLPLLEISRGIAKAKTKNFRKVDVADGAAYITDEMCENLLRMVGSWSNEIEEAFLILRGTKLNPKTKKPYTVSDSRATAAYNKIYTEVIGALKYTAYGYRYQDGIAVPYYNKMALFPMFKNMCTGNMAKLYNAAKDQKIDMIMIKSAVKLGNQATYKITDWDNIDLANHSYIQKYSNLRKQFNTDPKERDLMAIGTLMTKIVMSSIIPGREYNVNDELKPAKQIRDEIMTAINKLSDLGVTKIREKFFKDGKFDVESFSNVLKNELSSRGATKELIDGCDIVDGKMKLPLDAMSGMNWILSILVAMVNDEVIDIKTPGHAFYQRSVWGMEGETNIIGDDNLPPSINGGNKLKVLNKDGSMDCVLSIDFFAHILKGTKAEHADFESQRKYLIRKGIIGPNAKANMIGYRIPTLAISSIHALRCVDVIPTVRDTVILPAEFTAITGSDFDIDKLFISMKYYQRIIDKERSTKEEKHHKITDVFDKDKNPREYYTNLLIDNYLALLKDGRAFNQLNGPIDNDTSLLDDIIDDLEEGYEKNTLLPYQVSTLSFLNDIKDLFITGKIGIGPFALNNNSHILTMLYGVKFSEKYNNLLTKLGLTNLNSAIDRDGKSIMSWLSGLINVHVDVAKDPKVKKLNLNPYTYNLVNLLIRTGLGKTTFYFTTQSIMKQLASVYNTASGVYMIEEGLSKTLAQKEEIAKAILNYVEANTGKKYSSVYWALEDFKDDFKTSHDITTDDAIVRLFEKDCSVLHDIAKGGSVEDLENKKYETYKLTDNIELSMYEVQMLVVMANNEFEDPAKRLSDLVKYSKIDTKKQGKNIPEMLIYRKGVFKIFVSKEADVVFDNIKRLYEKSYIELKTRNAIDTIYDIFKSQTIIVTDLFNDIVNKLTHSNKNDVSDLKTVNKIINSVLAQVKSKFFFDKDNGYCKENNIDTKSLIDGKDSIYNRLLRLKAVIKSLPEYVEYRDREGEPINYLLLVLTSGYVSTSKQGPFNNAKFVLIASILQSEEIDPQEITMAWDNMLNDNKHPEIKKFAEDLVIYAFLTSADNGRNNDLFKYVPNSWKIKSGYCDHMQVSLERFQKGTYDFSDADYRDVILNNLDVDYLVPTVKTSNVTVLNSSAGVPSIMAGVTIGTETKLVGTKVIIEPSVQFTYRSISEAPNFVKTRYFDESTRLTVEYVYAKTDEGSINGNLYPIYTRVDSKTVKFKGGNYVYGYGSKQDIESGILTNDFLIKVGSQLKNAKTTIDDSGLLTISAKDNMELAIYESIKQAAKLSQVARAPEAPKKSAWVKAESNYNRESVQNDTQTLYIFTDNTDRTSGGQSYGEGWYKAKYGEGGFGSLNNPTTAQIRGLENAAPISTMRYFYRLHEGMTVADARWKDSDIEEFKKVINSEIEDIKRLWDSGKFTKIVSPAGDGFFNSRIAQISKDSEIGKYLNSKLKELYNYVNGINTISDKTEAYGVEISNGSKDFWEKVNGWQQNNPSGIVAYRKYGDNPKTFSTDAVNEGWIGNPFSTESKGKETVQQFYEWLVTGNNFGNNRATEEFRQAIILKILSTPENTPVLYYTELNRPSHATVIGYLVNNKHLLKLSNKLLHLNITPIQSADQKAITITSRQLSEVEEQLGRKIITPSNIPFMAEQLLLSVGGKQYDQQTLNRFLRVQNQIIDILYGKNISINQYVSIKYADWKRMLLINYDIFGEKSSNQLEYFVENQLLPVLQDSDFVNENDERYHNYDKKSKLITIPLVEYELINLLSNNPDYLLFLNQLSLDSSLEDILTIMQDKYENVADMVTSIATTVFEDGFAELITEDVQESLEGRRINISFSYTDSRQMEIEFDDSDQSDEMMKRCKE